jgi:hypothetical protein
LCRKRATRELPRRHRGPERRHGLARTGQPADHLLQGALRELARDLPGRAFFFGWQPGEHPDEAIYGHLTSDPRGSQAVGVMNGASVRIKPEPARIACTGQSRIKVTRIRAGVETVLVAETNANPLSADVAVEPGDTIVWHHRCQHSGATCTLSNIELATAGELLHPTGAFFTFEAEPT